MTVKTGPMEKRRRYYGKPETWEKGKINSISKKAAKLIAPCLASIISVPISMRITWPEDSNCIGISIHGASRGFFLNALFTGN